MAKCISNKIFSHVFIFVITFFTMQSTQVGASCSRIIGDCAKQNCQDTCRNFPGAAGGRGSCHYYNLCTCAFNFTPPTPKGQYACSMGLGLCDDTCDSKCCNERCAKTYVFYKATGSCMNAKERKYCICSYNN
ncbi:hypothetical protein KIW84_063298 [Lathyrus oleraceus]|uniref:Defensin-like protein n=1 Tax=Pisum sativum TaxID=3888 RepID=A0A9D5A9G7_PEA|nr:hypothetical protein KIW84_063298 [Pisum sativum]